MLNTLKPVIGTWYVPRDKGQMFQVIDIDDTANVVDIQHFDGDLEEFEFSEWRNLQLDSAALPEDWTGPVDDIEPDDLGYSETGMSLRDWGQSLAEFGWADTSLDPPELPPEDEDMLEALLH